jgi:hypothetical protein
MSGMSLYESFLIVILNDFSHNISQEHEDSSAFSAAAASSPTGNLNGGSPILTRMHARGHLQKNDDHIKEATESQQL